MLRAPLGAGHGVPSGAMYDHHDRRRPATARKTAKRHDPNRQDRHAAKAARMRARQAARAQARMEALTSARAAARLVRAR